jgi:hypothetical protein
MNVCVLRFVAAVALVACLCFGSAEAAAPAGRYSSPSIGVVHDSKTGLDWQQTTTSMRYTYADALNYCPTGWRLPTIRELQSLVDDAAAAPPAIDTGWFPSTQAEAYWSSTKYAPDTSLAWHVYFYDGYTGFNTLQTANYVRCVR